MRFCTKVCVMRTEWYCSDVSRVCMCVRVRVCVYQLNHRITGASEIEPRILATDDRYLPSVHSSGYVCGLIFGLSCTGGRSVDRQCINHWSTIKWACELRWNISRATVTNGNMRRTNARSSEPSRLDGDLDCREWTDEKSSVIRDRAEEKRKATVG